MTLELVRPNMQSFMFIPFGQDKSLNFLIDYNNLNFNILSLCIAPSKETSYFINYSFIFSICFNLFTLFEILCIFVLKL